jgi:hypothetical protein
MRVVILAVSATLLLAAPAAAAPQWLQPVTVGGPSGVNVEGEVAVAPDGTTLMAWNENIGGKYRARARVRPAGGAFGSIHELTPADGREAGRPRVGVDQQGNFTVVWDELQPPTFTVNAIRAARLPAGAGAFENVETVSSGNNATSPRIGVGGNGTAVIAFLQDGVVKGAIRNGAGGEFSDPTPLSAANSSSWDVAVDDGGRAVAVWSRMTAADTFVVERAERPPGVGFLPPVPVSSTTGFHKSTQPSLAMAPDSRALVLWTFQDGAGPFEVQFSERKPNGTWTTAERASKPSEQASVPSVAIAANGRAVASWIAELGSANVVQVAVREPDGAFTGHRNFASTTVSVPKVAGNRTGDTTIAWNGSMGEGVFAVRRPANADFGSVDTVALGTQGSAMPAISLFLESLALDDQGNATALWQKSTNPGGTFQYSIESASYDAAAPSRDAVSVPPAGALGSPIGMAATASDRLSTPSITWNFGDGTTGSGPAVSHAYGAAGAYSVTVSASDGAGNTTSTSRSVVIVAPGGGGPPATPRIVSPVRPIWGVAGKRIYLLRMRVEQVPRGGKVELRCKGKKCPYKRKSSKKRRKGVVTLFKEIKARKAVGKKQRTFRAGQTLQLRVTAPGHIGKVVKYRLRKGRIPSGQTLCLPVGGNKPRKTC